MSWKIISWVRNLGILVVLAGWIGGYPAGTGFGLLLMVISYQMSINKMEDILKSSHPDPTNPDDTSNDPDQP